MLDGLSKASQIAGRCEELGYSACALTDHGTIAGSIAFSEAMQKKDIKPILGSEFYLSDQDPTIKTKENRKLSHLVVLSKNLEGWKQLIKATSRANEKDVYYYKPRLNLNLLSEYCDGNLISFSGHPGSDLANVLFDSSTNFYDTKTIEEAQSCLTTTYFEDACNLAKRYEEIFGKGNFFLEIQLIDKERMPIQTVIADVLRKVGKETGISCVATADSHYITKEDAIDQRVILCSSLRTTLPKIKKDIKAGKDVPLSGFFKSNNYHIPSEQEIRDCGATEEEIENSALIASMCEDYSVLSPPQLPKYKWTEGMSENEYLRHLCREGWKVRAEYTWDKNTYGDRVKKELGVIEEAGLAGYFLIVQDYVNWAKDQGWLVGPGRGSSAGSLVSYLLGITEVDPIPHDLIFERFYNKSRAGALPDIDMDFPISKREYVIDYIRNRYGEDKVSQMVTFGRMMGRGALKEVLRVHEACDNDTANRITKEIPQEAEIADKLEESGETSILRWTLQNYPKAVSDYCTMNEDGSLSGEYKHMFEQAIRLEGTFKSQGKHAAGLVVASQPLNEVCPMVHDKKSDRPIAGMEMGDLEKMGHVKLDILGLLTLDRLMGANDLLRYGRINS